MASQEIKAFVAYLEIEFKNNANPNIASEQKSYMKNQFEFYGIKAPERRKIQKPFFANEYLPPKENSAKIIKLLWDKPQREYQYFAQEFAFKYLKELENKDIELFEFLVLHKSWWDTVDFIAVNLIGYYFKKFPEQRTTYVRKWIESENIWLQRSALLFQLKYKEKLDTEILKFTIESLLGSKEFFINKAIGWILREYGKTNPQWVQEYVNELPLANLSKREALKILNKRSSHN
ncbi:DNA alkylation repair protein [Galbibacter sp. EGI 63066]|uniref:DNA alkylation repair protein n=1 Tax=Galbibacter sp. EGI 63066 TaxID=2993559 RepID=UPI002248BD33|nr:DNA alkylation repair protein [Galbibacter sp. EGI 63066]MCX2678736.1 DNA alkylation repair protein [Galbibacter sp. EGI 63066]